MECKLSNFSKDSKKYIQKLMPEGLFRSSSGVDALSDAIIANYKSLFPVDLELSVEPLDFLNSLTELKEAVYQKLITKKFSKEEATKIAEKVYDTLVEENVTPTPEEDNSAKITQTKTNKEIDEDTLSESMLAIFKKNLILENLLKLHFKQDLFRLSIIYLDSDITKCKGISSQESLNKSIKDYLSALYNKIYEYIKELDLDGYVKQPRLYGDDTTPHKKNPGAIKNLNLFYEYLKGLDDIEKTLSDEYFSGEQSKLLECVNALLTLLHFDDLIKDACGNKYLYINHKYDSPITIVNDKPIYKYDIYGKNANLASSWWTQERDGIKELGAYVNLIIELIPIIGTMQYLTKLDFILSLLKVKYAVQHLPSLHELSGIDFDKRPVESWRKVLEYYFASKNNTEDIKDLKLHGSSNNAIVDYDIKVLESIYKYLFEGSNGFPPIYRIEQYLRTSPGSVYPKYGICDSLFASLNSSSEMNYLQVEYKKDKDGTLKFVVSEKSKYNANQRLFLLREGINDKVKYSEDTSLFDEIVFNEDLNSISIQSLGLKVDLNDIKGEKNNIFKYTTSNACTITKDGEEIGHLNTYFRNQLNVAGASANDIEALLNTDEEGKDLEFVQLLRFIDSRLGTNFCSVEGMEKLRILVGLLGENKTLDNLLVASLRVSAAAKFNNDFRNQDSIVNISELEAVKPFRFSITNLNIFLDSIEGKYFSGFNYNDELLENIAKAEAILTGDVNSSITKNFEGSGIPNVSVRFTDVLSEFRRHVGDSAAAYLLFAGERAKNILNTVIDTDLKVRGLNKSVDGFTTQELFTHNLLKLLESLNEGIYYAQPVTYSDKKKFLNYVVRIVDIYGNVDIEKVPEDVHLLKIMSTQGKYYNSIFQKICRDYRILFNLSGTDLKVFLEANDKLKLMTFEQLAKLAEEKNVKIYEDLHYRRQKENVSDRTKGPKDILTANEILYYYNTRVFNDIENLGGFLYRSKIAYINTLVDSFFRMPSNIFDLPKSWIDEKSKLGILAKYIDENGNEIKVILGNKIPANAKSVQLNPLLNTQFYLHNVIGNNIKLGIVGSELHHPVKNLWESVNEISKEYEKQGMSFMTTLDLEKTIQTIAVDSSIREELNLKYVALVETSISSAQNTQFKRTVAIPGTIRIFTLDKVDGIADTYKYAVIEDILAPVYDFSGNYGYSKNKTIDAHDGSIWIDPFTSILENNSLEENEVGPVKKPLWDIDELDYGVRGLVKCASNTISNRIMLKSLGGDLNMFKLFKKMTDRFKFTKDDINLTKFGIEGITLDGRSNYFSQYVLNGKPLYYRDIDKGYYRITNFGLDEHGYYTIEKQINSVGTEIGESVKVYHRFNEAGEHTRYRNQIPPLDGEGGLTDINSLFKLHSALGGIYSMSKSSNGLVFSEISNQAVANFMIHVASPVQDYEIKDSLPRNSKNWTKPMKAGVTIDLTSYAQPLKKMLINCIINLSAIKCGAANVNSRERFSNNEDLRWAEVSTLKYGIQLDADHEADEAKVSEMTLVISALDATGLYHDEVSEVYQALGEQTLNALRLESLAVDEAIASNGKNIEKLYDIIGKTIINNINDLRGLTKAILLQIKKYFNYSVDHSNDKFLIPFSDSNIYGRILNIVGSVLNKKGIKRKYPGVGQVMVPAYGIYQIYEVQGRKMQYDDILQLALKEFTSTETDVHKYNLDVVKQYLDKYCPDTDIENINDLSRVNPLDHILILYKVGGEIKTLNPIYLNTLIQYYDFKDSFLDFKNTSKDEALNFIRRFDKNAEEIVKVVKVNKIPRDLAPTRIEFDLETGGHLNIFDTWVYKDLYKAKKEGNKKLIEKCRKNIPLLLLGFDRGEYIQRKGVAPIKITKFVNRPAEMIMSNIYLTKFGLSELDSMYDVLNEGPDYFNTKYNVVDSQKYKYDFVCLTETGKGIVYISLSPETESDNYTVKPLKWSFSNKTKEAVKNSDYTKNPKTKPLVVNRIYYMNDDNSKGFEIGRDIDVTDFIIYDKKNNKFIDKVTNKEVSSERKIFREGDRILEYVEFVSQSLIKPSEKDMNFVKYNIDSKKLEQVALKDSIEQETAELIDSIYKSDSFLMLLPAANILKANYKQVKKLVQLLSRLNRNTELGQYFLNVYDNVLSFKSSDDEYYKLNVGKYSSLIAIKEKYGLKENGLALKNAIRRIITPENIDEIKRAFDEFYLSQLLYHNELFIKNHKAKKYVSYQKSAYFVSSRIPAQTLQSFMLMECVGYNEIGLNLCAVSHWQTFLLGSDYDIDKSYMLGLNFDENGIYIKWSDLFDYSSLETLTASESLPYPKGRTYLLSNNDDALNINDYAIRIELARLSGDEVTRIKETANLLKFLNKLNNLLLTGENVTEQLLSELNKHENTQIPTNLIDKALLNFVSSHIQRIILLPGNLESAYTPVEIDLLREGKVGTPKENLVNTLTLYNPAMISIMQNQNMQGKAVTGIAANAQKALFMWRYLALEDLLSGNTSHSSFEVSFETIGGKPTTINYLPDLKDPLGKLKNLRTLSPKVSSDNVGSQYISAATDNAKELILAAINSGNKLAKCHLYLVCLGFDPKDIINFMTSPIISLIDQISDENIYQDYSVDVKNAIVAVRTLLNSDSADKANMPRGVRIPELLKVAYFNIILSLVGDDLLKKEYYLKLLKDFENLYKLSEEFTNFGRILGINQGVAQTKEDLINWKKRVAKIISDRENEKGIFDKNGNITELAESEYSNYLDIVGKFDIELWLQDEEYRNRVAEYYEKIKGSINIFYYLNKIPHFSKMFEAARIVNYVDKTLSIKSLIINDIEQKLRKEFPYYPEKFIKRIFPVVDELIIGNFIKQLNIGIPIQDGWKKLTENYSIVTSGKDTLYLNSDTDIANFKYIFENYIIPELQKDPDFINNEFVRNLVMTSDLLKNTPMYKININFRLKNSNNLTKLQYTKIVKGLRELLKKKYRGSNLSYLDLFALYNLIVNRNNYGSERMTEIFDDFISDYNIGQNFLGQRYLEYVGRLDRSDVTPLLESYTLKDILMKAAPLVHSTNGHNDPIVKTLWNGKLVYNENIGRGDYRKINDDILISYDPAETELETLRRQQNYENYGFGMPIASLIKYWETQLDTDNAVLVINKLLETRKLIIEINCG